MPLLLSQRPLLSAQGLHIDSRDFDTKGPLRDLIHINMHILVFIPTDTGVLDKVTKRFMKLHLYRSYYKANLHGTGKGVNVVKGCVC